MIDYYKKAYREGKMKKNIILTISLILTLGFCGIIENKAFAQTPAKNVQKPVVAMPLNVVANPNKYLGKTVKMQATFDKFSTLGLDYNKALRKSTDYIGILIQRDDVIDHNIPLSEMKLFLKKDLAEKHIDLDTGDKIQIVAKVFSTALNDPWLDVQSISVIKKAKKEENDK